MIPAADVHTKNNAKIIFSTLQVVGQHYYYRNSGIGKIYFLNIPKNASEFISNSLRFVDNLSPTPKSFCIIRNPLERFVSIFKYMVNVEERFDEFFESLFVKKNLLNADYIRVGVEHLMPQKFFVDNAPAEWKNNCQLTTMENFFSDGADSGFGKVGLSPKIKIPSDKINQSDYGDSYKEWLVNEIYSKYSEVFAEYLEQDYELYEQAKNNSVLFG